MSSEECYMKNYRDIFWEHDRALVDVQFSLNDVTTNKKELENGKRVYCRTYHNIFENKEKQKVFCKAIKLKVELCSRWRF